MRDMLSLRDEQEWDSTTRPRPVRAPAPAHGPRRHQEVEPAEEVVGTTRRTPSSSRAPAPRPGSLPPKPKAPPKPAPKPIPKPKPKASKPKPEAKPAPVPAPVMGKRAARGKPRVLTLSPDPAPSDRDPDPDPCPDLTPPDEGAPLSPARSFESGPPTPTRPNPTKPSPNPNPNPDPKPAAGRPPQRAELLSAMADLRFPDGGFSTDGGPRPLSGAGLLQADDPPAPDPNPNPNPNPDPNPNPNPNPIPNPIPIPIPIPIPAPDPSRFWVATTTGVFPAWLAKGKQPGGRYLRVVWVKGAKGGGNQSQSDRFFRGKGVRRVRWLIFGRMFGRGWRRSRGRSGASCGRRKGRVGALLARVGSLCCRTIGQGWQRQRQQRQRQWQRERPQRQRG